MTTDNAGDNDMTDTFQRPEPTGPHSSFPPLVEAPPDHDPNAELREWMLSLGKDRVAQMAQALPEEERESFVADVGAKIDQEVDAAVQEAVTAEEARPSVEEVARAVEASEATLAEFDAKERAHRIEADRQQTFDRMVDNAQSYLDDINPNNVAPVIPPPPAPLPSPPPPPPAGPPPPEFPPPGPSHVNDLLRAFEAVDTGAAPVSPPVTAPVDLNELLPREPNAEGVWPCPSPGCGREFNRERELRGHIMHHRYDDEDTNRLVYCPYCSEPYKVRGINIHMGNCRKNPNPSKKAKARREEEKRKKAEAARLEAERAQALAQAQVQAEMARSRQVQEQEQVAARTPAPAAPAPTPAPTPGVRHLDLTGTRPTDEQLLEIIAHLADVPTIPIDQIRRVFTWVGDTQDLLDSLIESGKPKAKLNL